MSVRYEPDTNKGENKTKVYIISLSLLVLSELRNTFISKYRDIINIIKAIKGP